MQTNALRKHFSVSLCCNTSGECVGQLQFRAPLSVVWVSCRSTGRAIKVSGSVLTLKDLPQAQQKGPTFCLPPGDGPATPSLPTVVLVTGSFTPWAPGANHSSFTPRRGVGMLLYTYITLDLLITLALWPSRISGSFTSLF